MIQDITPRGLSSSQISGSQINSSNQTLPFRLNFDNSNNHIHSNNIHEEMNHEEEEQDVEDVEEDSEEEEKNDDSKSEENNKINFPNFRG